MTYRVFAPANGCIYVILIHLFTEIYTENPRFLLLSLLNPKWRKKMDRFLLFPAPVWRDYFSDFGFSVKIANEQSGKRSI